MSRGRMPAGLLQAATLAGVGLLAGAAAGWWGLARGDVSGEVAAAAAGAYPLLGLVLPVVAALHVLLDARFGDDPRPYRHARLAVPRSALSAAGGAVVASLLFAVAAANVPAVFGSLDPVAVQQALFAAMGWAWMLATVAVTTVAGGLAGAAATSASRRR